MSNDELNKEITVDEFLAENQEGCKDIDRLIDFVKNKENRLDEYEAYMYDGIISCLYELKLVNMLNSEEETETN